MKLKGSLLFVNIALLLLLTSCKSDPIASIEISYEEPTASIEITQPVNTENILCDTSQGNDQCYINIAGTAEAPEGYHVCLFLQFQGSEKGWIGGGQGYISNNEWRITNVGIGPVEEGEYPPLMVSAYVTDETCTSGNKQNEKGNCIVETSILIKR